MIGITPATYTPSVKNQYSNGSILKIYGPNLPETLKFAFWRIPMVRKPCRIMV